LAINQLAGFRLCDTLGYLSPNLGAPFDFFLKKAEPFSNDLGVRQIPALGHLLLYKFLLLWSQPNIHWKMLSRVFICVHDGYDWRSTFATGVLT
jgi:hypothetical protein